MGAGVYTAVTRRQVIPPRIRKHLSATVTSIDHGPELGARENCQASKTTSKLCGITHIRRVGGPRNEWAKMVGAEAICNGRDVETMIANKVEWATAVKQHCRGPA